MTPSSSLPTDRHPNRLAYAMCACIALLGLCAFSNSFQGAFVYDDNLCILNPPSISQWIPLQQKMTTGGRRWFTHLTIVANYKLHGYDVWGYHAANLAIHVTAALLLFGVVRRTLLLPATRSRFCQSANWLALAVACIWLVHPLQTESVTYVVQRLESLAGMFFLLTLYAVLRAAEATTWRVAGWSAAAVIAVSLGVGSKETMFLAPLAALAFDRIYLASSWRGLWKQRGYLYLGMLPAVVWSIYSLRGSVLPSDKTQMGFGLLGITPWEYLRSQPAVLLHYLQLSLWPQGQCLDYAWPVEHDSWRIFGLGAIVLGLLAGACYLAWRSPRLGFVALMFFYILAPTSSFMPIRDLAFEHRMYLPLACLVILVVMALHALFAELIKSRPAFLAVATGCCVVTVVGLTVTTWQRNTVYYDPVTVWRDATIKAPWNQRAHYNLGESLINRGMFSGDIEQYRQILLHDPKALRRIASRDVKRSIDGDLTEAVVVLQQALKLDPRDASAHFNLGGVFDRAGQVDEAIAHYTKTIAIKQRHVNARLNLARLLGKQGKAAEADAQFQQALKIDGKQPSVWIAYGRFLVDEGQYAKAAEKFREALRLDPQQQVAAFRLAGCQWELGEQRAAITLLSDLRQRRRSVLEVNLLLARYYLYAGQANGYDPATAAAIAREMVEIHPQNAEAHILLAGGQLSLGRYAEAAVTIQQGLTTASVSADTQHSESLRALQSRLSTPVSAP